MPFTPTAFTAKSPFPPWLVEHLWIDRVDRAGTPRGFDPTRAQPVIVREHLERRRYGFTAPQQRPPRTPDVARIELAGEVSASHLGNDGICRGYHRCVARAIDAARVRLQVGGPFQGLLHG